MNINSQIVALSSAIAFSFQIALALLILHYFSPEEVGIFSVVTQIGFFWTTLALAQTPLRLLANQGASVFEDAREAWVSSVQRFLLLLPFAALTVWWSGLSSVGALLWAIFLSFFQLTWMLAQSMRMRMVSPLQLAGVRVVPSLSSLIFAGTTVLFSWDGPALLSAALFGYVIGAIWFLPVIFLGQFSSLENGLSKSNYATESAKKYQLSISKSVNSSSNFSPSSLSDDRATSLRIGHAFLDALLGTAIVVVWQRLYGSEETGWMAAPLRVMGFLPAVVNVAWAQVLIAKPHPGRNNSLLVGLGGFSIVLFLSATCAIALESGWIHSQWKGTFTYLLPLSLWQGCACISAAYGHQPFKSRVSSKYSWVCIGVSVLQASTLLFPFMSQNKPLSATMHIWLFSCTSALGMLSIAYWLENISPSPKEFRKES